VYVESPELVTSHIGAEDYAVYAQDSWRPASRLTVSAGIRADYIVSRDLLFDLETSRAWNVGPRVGAAYSLTADQRNILRASWGRVYDIPNASYLGSAGSNRAGSREEFDLDLDGTFETVFTTPASSAVSTNREIDPDRHQGFTDEWIVGYRAQLPGQLSVDVSYVDRAYKDRPALVEQNGIYDGGVFRGYRDEAFNEIYLVTNNRWNWFVYRGLELTANKRAATWQVYGTYTLATQQIDGTWQPNDPASFIQPDAFANDAGLGTVRGNTTNSLGGDTRNRMWQKHQLRTGATWNAPWRLILATNVSVQSGTPTGPVTTNLASPDPQFGQPTLRLSNGRLVSNPLATTLRFAYSDRGTGQLWTPWLTAWNLRVGRAFDLRGVWLDTSIDVFNVTNSAADQQFVSGGNQVNSPNFGLLTNRQCHARRKPSFACSSEGSRAHTHDIGARRGQQPPGPRHRRSEAQRLTSAERILRDFCARADRGHPRVRQCCRPREPGVATCSADVRGSRGRAAARRTRAVARREAVRDRARWSDRARAG
jgi:hypothetical protein